MAKEASSGSYLHAHVPAEFAREFACLAEQNFRSIPRELRLAMVPTSKPRRLHLEGARRST